MAKKKGIRYIEWRLKWEVEFRVCIKSIWLSLPQIWCFTLSLSTCLFLFSCCTFVNNRSTICQSSFCLLQFLGHMLQINAIFVCVCVSNRRICCFLEFCAAARSGVWQQHPCFELRLVVIKVASPLCEQRGNASSPPCIIRIFISSCCF